MATAVFDRSSPQGASRVRFSPRLLFKITLPYVALALVLALAAVYVVARMDAESIAAAWSRQTRETRLRVADEVVRTEQRQLADARTLARLSGLPQAVQAGDGRAAQALALPFMVSQQIERVVLLDMAGRPLGGLRLAQAGEFEPFMPADAATWPFVATVLRGTVDALGDKYAGMVEGDAPALYVAVPLYQGETPVGVLLVGAGAPTLVRQWREASLADVTLYAAGGRVLASSLGTQEPAALAAFPAAQIATRELALGSRSYAEFVEPLVLRAGATSQRVGVALSARGQQGVLANAKLVLLIILAAGLSAAILLGATISSRITRPITALARAAEGVAAGDLERSVPVTTRDEVGALTRSFNTMIDGLRERERMHDIFGRFVSPTVAQLVLSRPLALSGESKILTILFTDLRDFTTMTEREDPALVISSLNDYFHIVVEAADRHGGIVNKFGGDSTLVLFGLTDEPAAARASAVAAARAAIEIRAGMEALNQQRSATRLPELVAGIGINTGAAIAGLIGAERRMEYTVIGDAVNLSARIQALNRELAGGILISDATRVALGDQPHLQLLDHGVQHVKGKLQGVQIFALMNHEASDVS